ncbi:ATPase associated with various cellular activities AAA_5 [Mycolicibacterium rhodesiae JS60]|nr:ATPase associated with various cellular activities AAA_5 [Mycolicibacterium rhodesiae JS60]
MTNMDTTVTVLDACGMAGVAALLISGPGSGKSSLVRGLAKSKAIACEVVNGALREPSDFGGLPIITADGVVLEAPRWAKRLHEAGAGILLLEELTTVGPAVQAAMLTVVLEREVGDLTLPPGIQVIAACNPADLAVGGQELPAPLANRFCHITFEPTTDEWLHGITTDWKVLPATRAVVASAERRSAMRAAVTGFIHSRPDLRTQVPDNADAAGGAYPTGRSWDAVTRVLAYLRSDDLAAHQTAVFGLVGEGAGMEFLTWMETADLPDPDAVTADPSIVEWAGARQDRVWAVLNSVVTLAAERGTVEAWRKAWKPLGAAAEAVPDMAAASARSLAMFRPATTTKIPVEVRKFAPMLKSAGLLSEDAA